MTDSSVIQNAFSKVFIEDDYTDFFNKLKGQWNVNNRDYVYKSLLSWNSSTAVELFGDKYFTPRDWDFMLIEGLKKRYDIDVIKLIISKTEYKYEYAVASAINVKYPLSVIKQLVENGFDYSKSFLYKNTLIDAIHVSTYGVVEYLFKKYKEDDIDNVIDYEIADLYKEFLN